jgi:hypothetical protein
MAGCLRSTVLLALHSKLIETIGRLPGLIEKLQKRLNAGIIERKVTRSIVIVKVIRLLS